MAKGTLLTLTLLCGVVSTSFAVDGTIHIFDCQQEEKRPGAPGFLLNANFKKQGNKTIVSYCIHKTGLATVLPNDPECKKEGSMLLKRASADKTDIYVSDAKDHGLFYVGGEKGDVVLIDLKSKKVDTEGPLTDYVCTRTREILPRELSEE